MNQEDVEKTIITLEKKALEEWNKGNIWGYLAIYASDITYFDPFQKGRIDGFEQMKAFYKGLEGTVSVNKYEMINPIVQTADSMAVLTYNLISYTEETSYHWNCTEVYRLEENGDWKIAHNHWSFVRPIDMKF